MSAVRAEVPGRGRAALDRTPARPVDAADIVVPIGTTMSAGSDSPPIPSAPVPETESRAVDPRIPLHAETDRLELRRWRHDDLDEVTRLFAQPEFWRYPFGGPLDAAAAERFIESSLGHWARHGFGRYAAVSKESGRLVGYVGLQYAEWFPEMPDEVEIGWRIDTDEWGKGLATEGAALTLRQGFEELGLERIICVWEPANTASGRIADKLGMHRIRSTHDPRGLAIEVMRLDRDTWLGRSAST